MPTPTTTASPRRSARIPAIFRGPAVPSCAGPSITTSLGHLSLAGTPYPLTASLTASPATSGTQPQAAVGQVWSGRSTTENNKACPGGDTHERPSRPRPAVCSSATTTVHSGTPAPAKDSASSLVDSAADRTVTGGTVTPRAVKAWATDAAVSGDTEIAGSATLLPYPRGTCVSSRR